MAGRAGHITSQLRQLRVCEGCRVRHLKCDMDARTCRHCAVIGLHCIRPPNIRFHNHNDSASGADLTFPVSQVWIEPGSLLEFHDETPSIKRYYQEHFAANTETNFSISVEHQTNITYAQEEMADMTPASGEHESVDRNVAQLLQLTQSPNIPYYDGQNNVLESPRSFPEQAGLVFNGPSPQSVHIAVIQANHSGPHSILTPSSAYADESPNTQGSMDLREDNAPTSDVWVPRLSHREAVLMRNFIDNMALWADVTDLARHFELEVPRRAMQQPVLCFAVLAFSSRHLSRAAEDDGTEAIQYHNQCLQLLITAITDSRVTEDVLAAVAILRQYEEMDETDNRFHLTGTTRILNSISRFGSSGGLGEAAAWLCLRQDIYVSLVSQRPLKTHLENFNRSEIFWRQDDMAWACRMVFLLAKVLSYAFTQTNAPNDVLLQHVSSEVDRWNTTKPVSFEPIKYVPRGRAGEQRLPEIWLLSSSHVIGRQYYHIAKIVLAVSVRRDSAAGYEDLRHGRKTERNVRDHLLMILGLAKSNERAENTLFTARHALSVWGGVLRNKLDQVAAENFLKSMEIRTGWSASQLTLTLREQWDEDSDRG